MIPVILSGGSGSRLWPLSRQHCPKQFLAVHTEKTLFQETILRLKKLRLSNPTVVCMEEHHFTVVNNILDVGIQAEDIILQPVARGTAPAIAVAALAALENHENPTILILPVDHAIENEPALASAFKTAEKMAEKGFLVTFGVKPTEAHTGYGYIDLGHDLGEGANQISNFIEKPNKKNAEEMVNKGGYLWNSGMFCFKASLFIAELNKYHPEIIEHSKKAVQNSSKDHNFLLLNEKDFEQCTDISIDYAVMEKTDKGCVVGIDANWSDIGSWDAVWQVSEKDENNNVCKGDVITQDSRNSFIYSEDKLLVTLGVDGLMVVDTPDALLIADKTKVQNVKSVVEQLKAENRKEAKNHSKVDRPWGYYELLFTSDTSEIKRILLKKQAKISLQKHEHRSEHWVVLKGNARVVRSDETLLLSQSESVYIPVGVEHSLENIGDDVLEIIEVRTGEYIDENDIVRMNS